MKFSLGFLRAESVVVRVFEQFSREGEELKEIREKIIPFSDMEGEALDILIYQEDSLTESQNQFLEDYGPYFNLFSEQYTNIHEENLSSWDFQQAFLVFDKLIKKSTLRHNLSTLEDLFKIIDEYRELKNEDRNLFFQEMWRLVKKNLGASYLKFVYPDIDDEASGKNHKLIERVIEGNTFPQTMSGSFPEKKLMEIYSKTINNAFHVSEYNHDRKELLIVGKLNKGPVLIMANCLELSRLQTISLKLIFEAFQE